MDQNQTTQLLTEHLTVIENKIKDTKELLDSHIADETMRKLAREELSTLETQKQQLEDGINASKNGYTPKSSTEGSTQAGGKGDCIMEIRAGAGGNEAGLFANNLYNMYTKYAESKGWKIEIISKQAGGIGNIKETSFEIKGKRAPGGLTPYEEFKFETGVHRVQRVPSTESGGRIHTSTATVAVLPIIDAVEMEIRTEDLQVDTFRASGAGGQHVNKTNSAIRITHKPTGVVVQCQDDRSQHKNRDKAMTVLRSKLFEMMESQQKTSLDEIRSGQVGTGDRSEKIRTYNFPQDRITDHRVKSSWHGMERRLEGDIEEILKSVREGLSDSTLLNPEAEH